MGGGLIASGRCISCPVCICEPGWMSLPAEPDGFASFLMIITMMTVILMMVDKHNTDDCNDDD